MRHAFIVFLLLFSTLLFSQTVEIYETSQKHGDIKRTGLATKIGLDQKFVKSNFKPFLKQFGKVTTSGTDYTIEEGHIPGINGGSLVKIYASLSIQGEYTQVFWAIDKGEEFVTSGKDGEERASSLLHDFGVQVYRKDIQIQIDDAEGALIQTVRLQEKTIAEGQRLDDRKLKNNAEKENLELRLLENANENNLIDSLTQVNILNQQAMEQEVIQMQQAVEIVKNKMNEVK